MNTFILTGTTRGLGKSLSKELSGNDYSKDKKVFISRQFSNLIADPSIDYLKIDLSEEIIDASKINLIEETKLVIFINNASVIEPISQTLNISLKEMDVPFNVNFKAPFVLAQYLALETQRIGASLLIINITSGAASRPIKGWLSYCTSKAAIKMAFDVIAEENKNVDVIHYDPGVMDTDMQTIIRSSSKDRMPDVELFQRFKGSNKLVSPDEVAKKICELIKGTL
ncbi:SDR family NAD(P)-dependent oxidoreductase [Acinetobacter sp. KS-LM10]|uniref:SDR family NAD(P)-dependent oxidoreductase n=1 Tax=Acinetobacter sp. KS-LM10 TaxID=3120518 RepID=UPI0030D34361